MRKSFTRLLSLVMLLGIMSFQVMAAVVIPATSLGDATKVLPEGATALTKTTDKAMVIYSQDVVASTGSIRLSDATGLIQVIPATDARVSFAKGDTVVIDLSANLKEFKEYAVTVDADAFKAADGTPATFTNPTVWGWKTGDYSGPTLKSVVPVKDAVVADQTTYTLAMTFEDVSAVAMGTGNVSLYKADGNVWDLIDVTVNGALTGTGPYVLTLSTLRALEDNTNYAVTIDAGVVTDDGKRADAKKNSYAGLSDRTTWVFSTKDFSIPGYASGYPKIGTTGNTSIEVLVKANEVGTAYALAVVDGAGAPNVATIKAANNKVAVAAVDTEYAINLTGLGVAGTSADYDVYIIIENADVAAVDADRVMKDATTSENTAPLLAAVSYKKGTTVKTTGTVTANVVSTAAAVAQDADNIILDFNEDVKIGSGNIIIRKAADNSDLLTIDASSLSVDATDKSLVKVPVSGFENNAGYYVLIPNTIVLDKYDNKYAGMSSTTAWAFTSNDIVGPTFTYTPAEGASNVDKDANIVLLFDELIYEKTGFDVAAAYNASGPANPFQVQVNGTSVAFAVAETTNDGKYSKFTINPTASFTSEAVITVIIKANSLADVGGNVVDPEGQGIVFVVEDYVSPVVTWNTIAKPADKAIATFDEAVYLVGGGEITDANLFTILTVKETDLNGANVPYTATIDANKKKITITPDSPWGSEKTYYIAVTSDLEDKNGTAFNGTNRTKTFLIDDVTPATVDLSSVDGKTIATTDAITLIFKEGSTPEARASLYHTSAWNGYVVGDMTKVIVFKEDGPAGPDVAFSVTSGDAATFAISATLVGNKTYYLGVAGSTKGTDGNVNESKFVTFNTKFEGVPAIVSLSPADNATEVAKGSNFVITYNTDVLLKGTYATGDITITDGVTPVAITSAMISITGAVVTINPTADLADNKAYDITVAAGTFTNKNKITSVSGAIATDAWDFTTKDTQIAVATLTPDEVATAAINAKLVMTFAEKVAKGAGYVDIKLAVSDALVERIDINSASVALSNSDKTVTITPTNNLKYLTAYYVEVSAGALVDAVANPLAAIDGKTTTGVTDWTFTTADPDLSIVKWTPADGDDKVASDAAIVVEFNRDIIAGAGSIGYIEAGSPDQTQSYPIGSTNITISGKTLTITHGDKVFPDDTEIFVYIEAGAIKAATGTKVNAVVNKTSTPHASFNTGDVNAPKPTFTPTAYNAGSPVYHPVNTAVTIVFDEDIFNNDGTSITNADVTSGGLFSINSGAVNFVGVISGKTVTLTPTSNLAEFTEYTISVNANEIEDSKGTTITSAITSKFWTVDATAPTITAFTLTGGAKKFTVPNVTVTDPNKNKFYYMVRVKSTDAAPTAADIKAANNKDASGGTVSTFDVTGLLPSTTYQFYYVADDKMGNTSTVAVLEASTDDTVAPTLASTNPATGAMDVNVAPTTGNIVIKLTFDEAVQLGTGAITVRDYATQGLLFGLTQTALTAVAGDSKSLNLTVPGFNDATSPVKLYVEIAAGTIKDAATTPNNFAGVFGMDALAFTTEDNKVPTVVASSSTKGNVALDTDIKVAFSEDVQAGTGNLVLYKGSVAPANAIQVINASEAVFSGKTATVNPTADLVNGQVYVVSVQAGFAKDVSSNANPVALDNTVTFTGTMNPAPSVTFSPAGGSVAVAKVGFDNIHVTFSENIYLTIAGYSKPLSLLTQAELLANISFVDGNGVAIPIANIEKVGANHFDVEFSDTDIDHESSYVLTISNFEDIDGQVMDDAVANYITSDGLAPSITFNPANKATAVALGSPLTLTFSEDVYEMVIDANKNIFAYIDNTNVTNFVYLNDDNGATSNVSFTASISGRVITIVPDAALKSGTRYYYGLLRDVEDINGTTLAAGSAGAKAYFDTEDTEMPELGVVSAANFAPLGAGTAANAGMWVKFDEKIAVSTGSVVIRREDGTIFQTVGTADLSIHATDNTKLVIAHNNFEVLTDYFVELEASVVADMSGNGNAAYSNAVDGWKFTTRDTYAMTAETSPVGDNTPRAVTLELMFNKVPTAAANKYVAVYKADGTAVAQIAATSMIIDGMKASFPGVALDADQSYYARVEANAFADASGNKYAGIMDESWAFSTVDNNAPKVVTLSPEDNATGIDTNSDFMMTFDRDIAAGTGMIAIRLASDGTLVEEFDVASATIDGMTLSFAPTAALAANSAMYVIVPEGAVTNTEVTLDPFAGIVNTYGWNFTTSTDLTGPALTAWTPQDTIADNHPIFEMTFDEAVVLSTAGGNLVVTEKDSTTAALTLAITADMISTDGMTVTVTYDAAVSGGLNKDTEYSVAVDAGTFEDAAGNAFAGVTDATVWTFVTGPDFATDNDELVSGSLEFKVYPNPFNDFVKVDNGDQLSRIVISNVAGQRVKDIVNPTSQITTGELRSGIYFITLIKDDVVVETGRIVKR